MENELKIIKRNEQKVLELLNNGEVDYIETISVKPTDEIMLFSIESGLLDEISNLFPEKRSKKRGNTNECINSGINSIKAEYGA